jgi:hypothetical protein
VIDLCEAGLRWLSAACEQADDSDGYMGGLMQRLSDMHLRACAEARPDPENLAARLFHAEMGSEYGVRDGSVEAYAAILGEEGLAAYRALAEAAWAKVPHRAERSSDAERGRDSRITAIMETLARQSGNVDQLVSVLERDLREPSRYLRIAEILREAGRHDEALGWAERGMKTTSGYAPAGLRHFVAAEYQRRDRHADAVRIMWIDFRESPGIQNYQRLEEFARAADDWDDWRSQALALVRKSLAEESRSAKGIGAAWASKWSFNRRDRSLLVEIFLHERLVDDAWVEAKAGGCSQGLWMKLAGLRQKAHPADAMSVYLRLGEDAIGRSSGDYSEAVDLLEKAAAAARSAKLSAEFEAELAVLLLKFKAKRNLQKRAEERRKFLYLSARSG